MSAGSIVVASAGNESDDATRSSPAACDDVITVAASDGRDHLARYSNFGPSVGRLAPGGGLQCNDDGDGKPDGILSIVRGGYARSNGTTMAAARVAGVVALVLAEDPTLTGEQAFRKLQANALPRESSQCPRPGGAGLLNAFFGNRAAHKLGTP